MRGEGEGGQEGVRTGRGAEVKIRFSGCAVNCPGTSNFAQSLAVLSGHVHRTRPSISQSVWSLLQNCITMFLLCRIRR